MALKATIYKANLHIADMDRHYYADHNLTLACHPSETEERLMLRLLVFALFASDSLEFGRGISTDDEPDLWDRDLTGAIAHWIDLGQPEEALLRKACGRAQRVTLLCYGSRAPTVWWQKNKGKLAKLDNLSVSYIAPDTSAALAAMAHRNMDLQFTIQDGAVWVADGKDSIEVVVTHWQESALAQGL